ncbi:hypothetical protein BGZ54_008239 [Gamsiella multidivaricata]|nr:hypothetical protein BGZ54_008239 [Gamsiella multidivaricata]
MTGLHESMHSFSKGPAFDSESLTIEDALKKITKGLTNPQYFEDIRPFDYDVAAYRFSCGKVAPDKELEREWISVLVPRLKASKVEVFRETGTRLEMEWTSKERVRRVERFGEEEENRMRRFLGRTKYKHREAALDQRFSDVW